MLASTNYSAILIETKQQKYEIHLTRHWEDNLVLYCILGIFLSSLYFMIKRINSTLSDSINRHQCLQNRVKYSDKMKLNSKYSITARFKIFHKLCCSQCCGNLNYFWVCVFIWPESVLVLSLWMARFQTILKVVCNFKV